MCHLGESLEREALVLSESWKSKLREYYAPQNDGKTIMRRPLVHTAEDILVEDSCVAEWLAEMGEELLAHKDDEMRRQKIISRFVPKLKTSLE